MAHSVTHLPIDQGRGGRALPSHRKSGNPGGRGATTSSHLNPLAHVSQWAGNVSPSPRAHPAPPPLPRRPRPHLALTSAPTRLPHTPPPNSAALGGHSPGRGRLCAAPHQPALGPRGPASRHLTESTTASQEAAPSCTSTGSAGRRREPEGRSHGGGRGRRVPAGWSPREAYGAVLLYASETISHRIPRDLFLEPKQGTTVKSKLCRVRNLLITFIFPTPQT